MIFKTSLEKEKVGQIKKTSTFKVRHKNKNNSMYKYTQNEDKHESKKSKNKILPCSDHTVFHLKLQYRKGKQFPIPRYKRTHFTDEGS